MLYIRKTRWLFGGFAACILLGWPDETNAGSPFSEIVSFGASWDMNNWTNGLAWPDWLPMTLVYVDAKNARGSS